MRRLRRRQDDTETALANFALTFAKAMLVVCAILFLLVQPAKHTDGVRPRVDYLITVHWPGRLLYDVDSWVRQPNGQIVYYGNREAGYVFLERDDLGVDCVRPGSTTDGTCEEVVAIRGIAPGEYVVNLHLFAADHQAIPRPVPPVTATVEVMRMEPAARTVWHGTVQLAVVRGEVHVLRFTLTPDGRFVDPHSDDPIDLRVAAEHGQPSEGRPRAALPGAAEPR